MDVKELLKKYHSRLVKEAALKALLCGAIFGFVALLVFEFVAWIVAFGAIWLGAVVFVAVTAGAALLFYFKKFRPSMKQTAARIDRLGLEERVLTMKELENEASEIARIQREDTVRVLSANGINEKFIKIAVSVPIVVGVFVSAVFGVGMTAVSALAAHGTIGNGSEVIGGIVEEPKKQFEIEYEIYMGEGNIDGAPFQIVEEGDDASPVLAVPEEGFAFVFWSDGSEDPYRCDTAVSGNAKYYAVFLPVEDGEGDGIPMDGDEPSDLPADPDGEGNGGEQGDRNDPGTGAGGVYEEHNQVYDGETYYGGQVYQNAYDDAMERMSGDEELSDEDKDLINEYYKTIAK